MSTDITRYQPTASLPDMVRYAEHLANANLLPGQYRKQPANVLFAMEYGRTLGITPIAAITGIHVIEGKPSASAALISGLVRQAGHKLRVRGNDQEAWAQIIRADDPTYEGYQVTWTLERARQAGLAGKDVWKKYPAAMLKARAITEVARDACEEVLFGLHYTPEELGANVSEDGLPVDAPVQQLRRVQPGEADPWATQPARDFLAEAEAAPDADTVRRIWQDAKQAGMPAPTLNGIVEVGRMKAAVEDVTDAAGEAGWQQEPARQAAAEVVDGEVVEDEHTTAVAELRQFAAEHRITDIDADAYTALGAPLDDVSPDAIRALLAQLRASAAA
ncbi:hypothetical protein AB0B42_00455 [Streptomyces fradiae]|uniref:hypothetical protein n=1 Tax=Streptomyces fradiae TaxID=1906 RepID=UPI0033CAAD69